MNDPILTADESRRARRELGLSQQKVADQSGLGRTKLSWLEGGRMTPNAEFLESLRDFYEDQGVEFGEAEGAEEGDQASRKGAQSRSKTDPPLKGGEDAEADEVGRKRQEKAERSSDRGNSYRGGLRIAPEISESALEALLEQLEKNDQRIGELVGKETGDGVDRGGFLFGDGELELSGEDREAHEELMRRMAANYVIVGLLQGKPVIAPCGDERVIEPEKSKDHGELAAAMVLPYVCGPVPEGKAEAKMSRKERESAEERRAQLHEVQ